MENIEKYKSYCLSLGEALNEIVKDAIKKKRASVEIGDDFDTGYLMAFHRVITLMQQTGEIFEMSFEELGINFKEEDLIFPKKE